MNKVTLYGKDKSGGLKEWTIWTEGNKILVEYGKVNGKMQLQVTECSSKNIGKSNETSPEEQALLEMQSKINKQIDKGYRESIQELSELPILPMLAVDFRKMKHKLKFPCLISPKYDGLRLLAIKKHGKVTLASRGGKSDYKLGHIVSDLESAMPDNFAYDGEVYLHGLELEDILSASKKPNENTQYLQFWIFDAFSLDGLDEPFLSHDCNSGRVNKIKIDHLKHQSLKVVTYSNASGHDDIIREHKKWTNAGYEGIMLRNLDGTYEAGKRSNDLLKYKEFLDDEFKVLDVVPDKNGHAIFVVENKFNPNDPKHGTFDVVGGTHEERSEWLKNKSDCIGKAVTVKYQSLFKRTFVPQFPTLAGFREGYFVGTAFIPNN